MVLSQVEGLVKCCKVVLGDRFDASKPILTYMTKEERNTICNMVSDGMACGDIELSAQAREKFDTEKKLRAYAGSLASCWFARSTELNGGIKYKPANPGSRTGKQDETIKQLEAMKTMIEDAEVLAAIDAKIAERKLELQPKVTIDLSKVDAELLAMLEAKGIKIA
jgi:hypothetical protein